MSDARPSNPMWIFAWTIEHGRDQMEDFWSVHQTEAEADDALASVADDARLYCWAIAPIKRGSEPHYEGQ